MIRIIQIALALGVLSSCSPMIYSHGVPNMDTVEPGLLRVGCPTKEGWDYLKASGVKTYLGFGFDDECSKGYAEAIGIHVIRLPFEPGHFAGLAGGPTQDQLHQVRAILNDPTLRPLAYGCLHAQDRTGLATMVHRLDQGWTREAAYREAIAHHYHPWLAGLARAWREYRP